jgi:superfamily I DNA/RNA helicase/mRNA-degrading endonuclease RelE of RelBE toxin-antitoxin system
VEFRISDTFTDSLTRLTGEEQKAVKTTAFDLQMNPAGGPGMQFHKLDKAKDKNFWSVRVSSDLRLIVHKVQSSLLLCYVGHHDNAYQWAERRRLETHPRTGAAQLVEIRERVEEIRVPRYLDEKAPTPAKPALFAQLSTEDLLGLGVPVDWVGEVLLATEDSLLDLADHLPSEAAEALLDLATGVSTRVDLTRLEQPEPNVVSASLEDLRSAETAAGSVPAPPMVTDSADPFGHPDAQRRFRTVSNLEELERALEYPWEKWAVFLHPAQRQSVEQAYGGPARVSGSAGTGKTIVALHRAVFLARSNPDSRVLLTTFSEPLASALRVGLRRLVGNEPRIGERLEVYSLDAIGRRLYELNVGRAEIASPQVIRQLVEAAAAEVPSLTFSAHFLTTEWTDVVDAWQLDSWEAYRDVARLGRKTRLSEKQRRVIWDVLSGVAAGLAAKHLVTTSGLLGRLAAHLLTVTQRPFDFVVVDEAQDLSVAQLRFLAALGGGRPESLFFTGDLGQRIFQQPFSWKALGIDIRGRAQTLRINYRTSHQIRGAADRLLGADVADVDGNVERRRGTISVFNGPAPTIEVLPTTQAEGEAVGRWLAARTAEGIKAHEIGVFVRSPAQLDRARAAVKQAGLAHKVLDDRSEVTSGSASIGTMHLAKGLEFRAVAVMACDDEVIPLQERIQGVTDDSELEEVYNTERHLLYVACTRARDHLLVTAVVPASEFLDDLRP